MKVQRIAVLTSGGDAPGMNAAIRAVTRAGIDQGWEVCGVRSGYAGLIAGNFQRLLVRDVGGIIQQAGTFLGSARCPEFQTEDGKATALRMLNRERIDALVVIGGNGSQTGAHALAERRFPVVGVASTIDNDLYGSEMTIGVDTALNIALEAIDRLKATASSHGRAFLVEVMGRDCGYLALMAAIAGGAEAVLIPERETDPVLLAEQLRSAYQRGKSHALVVVAEGARHNAEALVHHFKENREHLGFEARSTILGHVQRGGTPGAFDRLLATRLGAAAVQSIAQGRHGVLMGLVHGTVGAIPLAKVVSHRKEIDLSLFELARVMAQ